MISYLNTLKYLLNKNYWELILGLNSNECYMENVYFLDNFSNKDKEDSCVPVVACIYINKVTKSIKKIALSPGTLPMPLSAHICIAYMYTYCSSISGIPEN